MSLSEELYKEIILEHSRKPSHRGKLEHPTVVEEGVNRSCGDEVELEVLLEDGILRDIRVNGRGCSISMASGSLMADAVEGKHLDEVTQLIKDFKKLVTGEEVEFPEELEDLEALKGVQKYPIRVKCATLSWNTLEQAIQRAVAGPG
ncbi:MAG: SUF system NifU family Fe-S cluster assembly protein [Leptospiraceae bacterium]|nr:SUF system NifU family Fe-S cluster assembly protein [Leptospiraceae bacterium]MCB1320878.1 SUF system NifU family Fe-S cluster assembly protein [Leptospiraceae bacterium]